MVQVINHSFDTPASLRVGVATDLDRERPEVEETTDAIFLTMAIDLASNADRHRYETRGFRANGPKLGVVPLRPITDVRRRPEDGQCDTISCLFIKPIFTSVVARFCFLRICRLRAD